MAIGEEQAAERRVVLGDEPQATEEELISLDSGLSPDVTTTDVADADTGLEGTLSALPTDFSGALDPNEDLSENNLTLLGRSILTTGSENISGFAVGAMPAKADPASKLVRDELHKSAIDLARTLIQKNGGGLSREANAVVDWKSIDALFCSEKREVDKSTDLDFPGVPDRLGLGPAAQFASHHPDLLLVSGLAKGAMPDYVGKLDKHQFASLGNSTSSDVEIPSRREVDRIATWIPQHFPDSGLSVQSIGQGIDSGKPKAVFASEQVGKILGGSDFFKAAKAQAA